MIEIHTQEKFPNLPETAILVETARQVLAITKTPAESGISLRLTTDKEMQELNHQHLGINAPTDVLSFPIPFNDPETGAPYLGDILVSVPTAARQAEIAGHSLEEEIRLLIVHGILHLLGHDHSTPDEKAVMWEIQDMLLQKLEISARPTEL
jgi:probable rRNA maturation factor